MCLSRLMFNHAWFCSREISRTFSVDLCFVLKTRVLVWVNSLNVKAEVNPLK